MTNKLFPKVTVIMPVRNEEAFIEVSLGAVLAQDYPDDLMEIFVVDGASTDATRHIIGNLQQSHTNLHLLDNPAGIVPCALNRGIRQSNGGIIVRVDGHTVIAPDYVRQCVMALQSSGGDNVGGRMNAVGETAFGEVVAIATSSPFGVGGARFHYSEQAEWVDTVYMGAWSRSMFARVGLFDEEMVRNQDDEFNYRIRAAGGRIWLDPAIKSIYTPRGAWHSLGRQYYQYGVWKVRVLQKHPCQMRLRQFVPFVFVLSLLMTLLLPPLRPLAPIITMLYVLADSAASVVLARRHGWRHLLALLIVHPTMHVAYGFGFLVGLVRFSGRWHDKVGQVPAWESHQESAEDVQAL